MKIGGMGEEALCVELSEIRRLNEIPADVEIVRVLPPLNCHNEGMWGSEWIAGDRPVSPVSPLYLHIKHRYCLRVRPGVSLSYESLDNFLRRYAAIKVDEESKYGLRVVDVMGQDCRGPWVDDDV